MFFFQAEDGIRDAQESRGLGDVYKRQSLEDAEWVVEGSFLFPTGGYTLLAPDMEVAESMPCLLYTSDAADDLLCVDLGGRRIIKKQKQQHKYACVYIES